MDGIELELFILMRFESIALSENNPSLFEGLRQQRMRQLKKRFSHHKLAQMQEDVDAIRLNTFPIRAGLKAFSV